MTFKKAILEHLGIQPGDEVALDLLEDGRVLLRAARADRAVGGFVGLLAGRTKKVATLQEMGAAAAQGWARGG